MCTIKQKMEQRLLTQSAAVMGTIGITGLALGILSDSRAVLADGLFSCLAVIIKLLMLGTSRLISKETSVRFQFGYWQMEPLVLFTEGVFTMFVVAYAAAAGVQGILAGGRDVDFGLAVYYGLFFMIMSAGFYTHLKRQNRKLKSNLVHFDNVSWYIDLVLAAGLMVSFAAAWALAQTGYGAYARYADPLIMLVLSLHMAVPAYRILAPSFRQILGAAPAELHERVQQVMDESLARYGFKDYVSSVQQYGNTKIIEIDILLGRDFPAQTVEELDAIRESIDEKLGYPDSQQWLTINFTASRRWMARDYLLNES